jgi:uncharacterized membrane protein YphA (DoxX/SURF4 family)
MRAGLTPILPLLLRLLLGGALLYAGLVKIPELDLFARTVRTYEVLPLPLVNPFAVVVPWMEVTTGLCLLLGFWTRSSALSALFLLLCFGAALGVNLHRGANLSCGCFRLDGADGSLHEALGRDALLICVAILVLKTGSRPPPGRRSARSRG